MKCKIEIEMGNAAFCDSMGYDAYTAGRELARILRELAIRIEDSGAERGYERKAIDYNGNSVGGLKISRR